MAGCQTATDLVAPGMDVSRACRNGQHARGFHISSALFIHTVMPTMTGDANRAVPEGGVPDSNEFVGPGGAGTQPAAAADVPEVATAAALDERCGASQARASPFCRPEGMPRSMYLFSCGVCRCTNTGLTLPYPTLSQPYPQAGGVRADGSHQMAFSLAPSPSGCPS